MLTINCQGSPKSFLLAAAVQIHHKEPGAIEITLVHDALGAVEQHALLISCDTPDPAFYSAIIDISSYFHASAATGLCGSHCI